MANEETQAVQDAPPQLTAADVLKPDTYYRATAVESLLGIKAKVIAQAFRRGAIRFHTGDSTYENPNMKGSSILAWIEKEKIPYEVADLAAQAYWHSRREMAQQAKPTEPEPPRDVLGQAMEIRKGWSDSEQEDTQSIEDEYLAVLLRADNPEPSDAERLADLMEHLEISPEQFQEDRKLIARALEWQERHDRRDGAHRLHVEMRDAHRELEKRHKKEWEESDKKARRAHGDHHTCGLAAQRLTEIAKHRPQFFAGSPPRLRDPQS